MAYIQEKVKGKKIVSFKIKACLGRDVNGKQLFKCTTWYPPADLTPAKARKEAQKVAGVWEEEVRQNYIKEQEARAVAGELPAPAPVYTFDVLSVGLRSVGVVRLLFSVYIIMQVCAFCKMAYRTKL